MKRVDVPSHVAKIGEILENQKSVLEQADLDPQDFLDEEGTGARNNRTRLVILVLVVGLALGYMVYAAFPGNALFFMSVSEFMAKEDAQDGRIVRVSGKLVEGSFQREDNSTLSRFQLVDKDSELPTVNLQASYDGVVPDLFFNPHSEIILQGSLRSNNEFYADSILVKCPSKFRSLEDELRQAG